MSPTPLLLFCCLLLTFGEALAAAASERDKLEGTWTFIKSAEDQNKDKPVSMRMVFKGDTVAFVSDDNKRSASGTYTVDPATNPKNMDITIEKGGVKAITLIIYELDGDTLKLCHYLGAKAGKERPKQFVADKQTVLGTLKRVWPIY
jgi:uncharacterized protein (TIGR03067 family)